MTERSPLVRGESRIIGGVCYALSKRYSFPTWVLRLTFVIASLIFALPILIYMIFWSAMPNQIKEDKIDKKRKYILQAIGVIVGGLIGWIVGYKYGLHSIGDDRSVFIFVFIFAIIGMLLGIIMCFFFARIMHEKYYIPKKSK